MKKIIKTNQSKNRIPDFANRQEAAAWWETHNIVDFLDELKPVKMKFSDDFESEYRGKRSSNQRSIKQPLEGLTLRLPATAIATLRERASQKGIGSTTLARMILVENLQDEHANHSRI